MSTYVDHPEDAAGVRPSMTSWFALSVTLMCWAIASVQASFPVVVPKSSLPVSQHRIDGSFLYLRPVYVLTWFSTWLMCALNEAMTAALVKNWSEPTPFALQYQGMPPTK